MNEENKTVNNEVEVNEARESHNHKITIPNHKTTMPNQLKDQEERKESNSQEKEAVKKYTDEDVDKLINKAYAKFKKQAEKEIDEAKKLADMDASEKLEYERNKLQEELSALKEKTTRQEMAAEARKLFNKESININDKLINNIITLDAETTKANVDAFISAFNEAVDNKVNEALKGKTPSKYGGDNKLTKADILNIEDIDARRKAIAENLELFE